MPTARMPGPGRASAPKFTRATWRERADPRLPHRLVIRSADAVGVGAGGPALRSRLANPAASGAEAWWARAVARVVLRRRTWVADAGVCLAHRHVRVVLLLQAHDPAPAAAGCRATANLAGRALAAVALGPAC